MTAYTIPNENDRRAQHRRTVILWDSFNQFVMEHGGSITTTRNLFPARLECSSDTTLPRELELATVILEGKRHGYAVRRLTDKETGGPVERITPAGAIEVIAGTHSSAPPKRVLQHAAIRTVACFDVMLRSV